VLAAAALPVGAVSEPSTGAVAVDDESVATWAGRVAAASRLCVQAGSASLPLTLL